MVWRLSFILSILLQFGGSILSNAQANAQAFVQENSGELIVQSQETNCLALGTANHCLLKTVHRSIEMVTSADHRLHIILKGSDKVAGTVSSVWALLPVSLDLDARVGKGEMTVDEATSIWREVANSEGTRYTLPNLPVLKSDLGFPTDAVINDDDLRDLCRAHLQVSLSVSPLTAAYIGDRMGLEARPSDEQLVTEPNQPSTQSPSHLPNQVPQQAPVGSGDVDLQKGKSVPLEVKADTDAFFFGAICRNLVS